MTEYREDQLTPEFPDCVEPARSGAYRHPELELFAYYDAESQVWGCWATSPEQALRFFLRFGSGDFDQNKSWRGLNFNPDAKGKK